MDIKADGRLWLSTLRLSPRVPEPFLGCFRQGLSGMRVPAPGPGGAHIEMHLGQHRAGAPR